MGALTVIVQPTQEPVSVAEAKEALRILSSDDDARVTMLIQASREFTEAYTHHYLMTQTLQLSLDYWPSSVIDLNVWPLQAIDSIKYDDTSSPSVEITLTENVDYYTDILIEQGRIYAIKSWPSIASKPNAIRIKMTAGYTDAASVPEQFKDGIKAYCAFLYDQNPDLEKAAKGILWPRRIL